MNSSASSGKSNRPGHRDQRTARTSFVFLLFPGLRKTEAKFITWGDVDFHRAEITVRGHPETGTKNDEIRRVPMIPELRELLESLRRSRPTEKPSSPVLRVFEAEKSMRRAAANFRDSPPSSSRSAPFVCINVHRIRRGYSNRFAMARAQGRRSARNEGVRTFAPGTLSASGATRPIRFSFAPNEHRRIRSARLNGK